MELHSTVTGPDYFQTMGTRLLRGREFDDTDGMSAPAVAIVNEAFVQRYLPEQDPIGKRLGNGGDQPLDIEIIGLVEDGKYVTLGEEPLPFVWLGADRRPPAFMTLVVRGAAHPGALTQPVRQAIAEVDPEVAITTVALANQHLAFALLPQRLGALLLGLFGLLGLSLAALGIYGVMAYSVTQRTREFGIRLALGARAADITRMVVRQGMWIAAIGGVVGLLLAAAVTRLMQFLLFDVAPLDPATFAGVTLIVAVAAFIANWLPARRTARVDPLMALRSE
jgi:putative ABC transport system permease protein